MDNFSIPIISDEELVRRYQKIKPVVQIDGVKFWLEDFPLDKLKFTSYIWSVNIDKLKSAEETLANCTFKDFECLHHYAFSIVFQPTIHEVLSQIPKDILETFSIEAFEIIEQPTSSADFNKHKAAFYEGFHTSTVRLYIRA